MDYEIRSKYSVKRSKKGMKKYSKIGKEIRKGQSTKKRNHYKTIPEKILTVYEQEMVNYFPEYDSKYYNEGLYMSVIVRNDEYVFVTDFGNGIVYEEY